MLEKLFTKKVKKNKKRYINVFFFILLLISLLEAGFFLTYTDPPTQVDVVIVLSGGPGRIEQGIELYNRGFVSKLLVSNAKESASTASDMLKTTLELGIPQEAILTENKAESTYQNAEFTLPIMKAHGFTSAIVVSSDFHMRRAKFIFDRVYKNSGIELTYTGSDSGFNAGRWWGDSYSRETTFNEYVKMIGNAFGYNGPEAKDVLNQIKAWFR